MQDDNWQALDEEFDEYETQYEKKKSARQKKRSWREIEAYKEKQREKKAMDINDHYYSM